jgi:hypothetical protein
VEDQIIDLTAQIVSAHVAANDVLPDQLPALIRDVHEALSTVGQAPAEPVKAESERANHPTNSGRFIRYAAISSSTSNDERAYRWPAQQLQSVDCFGNLHATERRGISQIHLPARGNALAEHRLSLAPGDTADWLYCGGCPNVSPLRWLFDRHLGSACPPPAVTNSPAHTAPAVSRNLA